ncbi:unnamed protein product [Didymodactylos carnosus]|uniref:Uncharacterized protein n=1 Tax=Didymodactylos carnosus TaxID=1234261 RepID=A0A816BJK2_9BILA|nr:unnamed protein product [Didymodactylos carnosus]CAF1610014.1 unnamed protein product [Didymodactylos carnosus]CAF4336245.1 unnamed protein product [Didymodactylos carnosus]CAF4492671.1 unnamed protein product [Didymodactylos carnosus]
MKATMNDDTLVAKINDDDEVKVMETIDGPLKWLATNQLAEKDEFEHKLKELETLCSPIMAKLCQSDDVATGESGRTVKGNRGPTIEEVDSCG